MILDKVELLQHLKEKAIRKARNNYLAYVKLTHNGEYKAFEHHKYVCNVIQEAIDDRERNIKEQNQKRIFIMLNMPPRHGKSMTVSETLPSYFIGKYPNSRSLLISYNDDLATRFGKKNREKIVRYGKEIFNVEIDPSTRSAVEWGLDGLNSGLVYSRGVGSGITGLGCDLNIIDDPIKNRTEANSITERNKIWNEWIDSISTRSQPYSITIIIMTRWHEDDLSGRLLSTEYGKVLDWKIVNLPLECDEYHIEVEGNPLNRKLCEPLWPEMYGKEFVEMRKSYPESYNALFQGRPSSQEGNLLKREWWGYYDKNDLPKKVYKIITVDAAFKDTSKSDFVVIQCWGKYAENYYLIDQIRGRQDFVKTIESIREMNNRHKDTIGIYIEEKANGAAIIRVLRSEIGGIIPVIPKESKEARVHAVSHLIEGGYVYLPKEEPFSNDFVEECAAFPKGANDDMVDCMSMGLNRLINVVTALEVEPKPRLHYAFEDPKSVSEWGGWY